ncbi:hypothetical protein M9458_033014, partial [Cirrhinus mrigala]
LWSTQSTAYHHPTTQSISLSLLCTGSKSPLRSRSQHLKERLSGGLPQSQSPNRLTRCTSWLLVSVGSEAVEESPTYCTTAE